jgi:hypothetical protein
MFGVERTTEQLNPQRLIFLTVGKKITPITLSIPYLNQFTLSLNSLFYILLKTNLHTHNTMDPYQNQGSSNSQGNPPLQPWQMPFFAGQPN